MNKYLKKFKATNYDHCVMKEELIISDDEKDDSVHVKIEPIDESFVDTDVEKNKFNGLITWKSELFGNENSFWKSKNADSTEQSKISNDVRIDEKPKATGKTACRSNNIDKLYKKYAKSYCPKCNVKEAVIRNKARCRECNIRLTYSCETCNTTYGDFTELGYHLKGQHTAQIHPCPVCNKAFSYRRVMVAHRRNQHGYVHKSGVAAQRCAKCGKIFESKHIAEHAKVCDAEALFKCDKCPFATTYRSSLHRHVNNKHTDFKKKCDNCDKTFTARKTMMRHVQIYCNKVKRFECHHCGHKMYRKDQMVKHLDLAHFGGLLSGKLVINPQMPPTCKYCDTTLDRYERLKYHLRRCESAPLIFRRQILLDSGYDNNSRTCKYCGLELKRYEHMRYHLDRCESASLACRLENETADQPDIVTACENLSKAYCENCKTKGPLKKRQRRCKKCKTILTFICERCPKNFCYAHQLLGHLRVVHVKSKKLHQCDKCNRSYSHLSHLNSHKKIHHPSKPTIKTYECSKCGKNYKNPESLRKHRISCAEEPKFRCDKCPYKTHFKSNLLQHFRAMRTTCT